MGGGILKKLIWIPNVKKQREAHVTALIWRAPTDLLGWGMRLSNRRFLS